MGHVFDALGLQPFHEIFVQPLRFRRRGGGSKRRPVALFHVRAQGKLGNTEHFPVHVGDGEVHFIVIVGKDPQLRHLGRHDIGVRFRIAVHHAQQHEESLLNGADDGPFHGDGGLADPLNDRLHRSG